MNEIIAALTYSNVATKDGKKTVEFAPGRLVAGILRLGVIFGFEYLYYK